MNRPAPTFAVGITGHRPNRLHIGEERTARRLWLTLNALHRGARCQRRVALSALAEGADRLFAQAALALGYELEVLLPFSQSDYEKTFADAKELPAFRELLGKAARFEELPGALSSTKVAYEAVGRKIVDASDLLIAVWDRAPAAGRGGTPEIIEYALAEGKPVIWIDALRDRLPLLLKPPHAKRSQSPSLSTLSGRAEALTRARVMRVAKDIADVVQGGS